MSEFPSIQIVKPAQLRRSQSSWVFEFRTLAHDPLGLPSPVLSLPAVRAASQLDLPKSASPTKAQGYG